MVKNLPASAGATGDVGLIPGSKRSPEKKKKIPWRREWQPTPVFLPIESHGQRSLVSYSPWGHKESDTPEQLSIARNYLKMENKWLGLT